jgi:hypothetical protein
MGVLISGGAKEADLTQVLVNLAAQNAVLIQQNVDLAEVIAALQVPTVNGVGNDTINQLIGNRNDDETTGKSLYALVSDMIGDWHGEGYIYPDLAAPVTVTSHADAYTLGGFAEIVPANAIDGVFHIHHLHLSSPDANGQYVLVFYNGTTELARISVSRTDKKDDVEGLDVRMPHCAANSQIQAKLASSNAASEDDLDVRLWYHRHM